MRITVTVDIPDEELKRALAPLLLERSREPAPGTLTLTINQAAKRLGVSYSKVYELIQRRELRGLRVGRSIRLTDDALAAFIQKHEMAPIEASEAYAPPPVPAPPVSRRARRPAPTPQPEAVVRWASRPRGENLAAARKRAANDLLSPADFAKGLGVSEAAALELYRAGHFAVIEQEGVPHARRGDMTGWMEREPQSWQAWVDSQLRSKGERRGP